jgi:Fe-S cluster biosynthesis and repair protein YggX
MFITVIRGRWLNTHHITEVNSLAEDIDGKRCTAIRMSNGDIVRLYPGKADYECFWQRWEEYLKQQEALIEVGKIEVSRVQTRSDVDETLNKVLNTLADSLSRGQ